MTGPGAGPTARGGARPGAALGAGMAGLAVAVRHPRASLGVMALLLLSACSSADMDWDLRSNGLDTTDAAFQAAEARPEPDANGVISYPNYQVVVARQGDTVGSVAARVGLPAGDLASFNALSPDATLRAGEILALPSRVAAMPATAPGLATTGSTDVTAIATTALDRVEGSASPSATAPATEPLRHQVRRGETAFSIARTYNVSAKALADWNGLGPDLAVREGQYLIIPTTTSAAAPVTEEVPFGTGPSVPAPGEGSATPLPPSAAEPLPEEETTPAVETPEATPAEPDLGAQQTEASAARFAMPADGKIIRSYVKGKNDGIDIAAPAGSPVKAAADGSVAAITKDTTGTPIVVLRHDGGLLTVYAGVDAVSVAKGDRVTRGQTIAKVKAGDPAFLHFEVRQGAESTDPMPYLQ